MFKTCLCKRFHNRFLLLGFRFTLLVLDFSVPGSLVEIDNMIGAAATILHQDHRNGMLCILPQRYSGQSVQSNITACRRIEDALLTNGISLETDIAMHFVVDAMHGNDRRPLSARARLCFSEKVVGDEASPWLASPFASRGKMADIPLMRIREMKRLCHPGHIGEAVEAYSLSPAERCQQKGSQAVLKIVEALIAETDMASPECRLDIIEMKVNMVPCWCEAALLMKQQWPSDSTKPKVSYMGFVHEDKQVKTLQTHLLAVLMQEWWESHPSAGPQEPTDDGPIDKPSLSLAGWSDSLPALADMVVTKFDGDDTYSSKWNGKVSAFREFVANKIAPLVSAPTAPSAAGGSASTLTGPDWTVGAPQETITDLLLPATDKNEFDHASVFFGSACTFLCIYVFFYVHICIYV